MTISLTDLERLLPDESVYPQDVVLPIRPRLRGRSFFPGGVGLALGGNQPYPLRPVMLVGQDFDAAPKGVRTTEQWLQLDTIKLQRDEEESPTWQGIQRLADDGLLKLGRAYFTNALLGARLAKSNTGRSPAWTNEPYVRASMNCLVRQIAILQPTVVMSLGIESTVLLSRRFGLVPFDWDAHAPLWPSIDQKGLQFVRRVAIDGVSFAFASCVHPSFQHLNASRRTWTRQGCVLTGEEAHRAIWLAIREHDESIVAAL